MPQTRSGPPRRTIRSATSTRSGPAPTSWVSTPGCGATSASRHRGTGPTPIIRPSTRRSPYRRAIRPSTCRRATSATRVSSSRRGMTTRGGTSAGRRTSPSRGTKTRSSSWSTTTSIPKPVKSSRKTGWRSRASARRSISSNRAVRWATSTPIPTWSTIKTVISKWIRAATWPSRTTTWRTSISARSSRNTIWPGATTFRGRG